MGLELVSLHIYRIIYEVSPFTCLSDPTSICKVFFVLEEKEKKVRKTIRRVFISRINSNSRATRAPPPAPRPWWAQVYPGSDVSGALRALPAAGRAGAPSVPSAHPCGTDA